MLCFHSSCISACMTSSELCGRWMAIWPSASASSWVFFFFSSEESSDAWGTMRRTRNSRATPREIEPMTARGPR